MLEMHSAHHGANVIRAKTTAGSRLPVAIAVCALVSAAVLPSASRAAVLGTVSANGYVFTNFDPSLSGTAVGSNANGISNAGQAVGTTVDVNNMSTFSNYSGTAASPTPLNTGAGQVALGIDSAGDVVGGNGTNAFFLPHGGTLQTLTIPGGANNAFGINDAGNIVGQYTNGASMPGFILPSAASSTFTTINAPGGPNIVNAQGINDNGQVVGFYTGTDGQAHGFQVNAAGALAGSTLTGLAIADPVIPTVPGEPGATFVFSQVLGINDQGLAVGYYGDSTTSQHGFLYDLQTGQYLFIDDPSEAFHNGVEVTQITGINNADEIAGFYMDAGGIAHSFTACPTGVVCPGTTTVPEPASLVLLGAGLVGLAFARRMD